MIALPFALNEVMKWESFRDFVGKDTDWLSFWGGYLGALVSAIVAFVILWITYNQNKQENKNNRELQIKTIEYQQQRDWLNQMRIACTEYVSSFYSKNFERLCKYTIANKNEVENLAAQIIEQVIKTDSNIDFLMQSELLEYRCAYNQARKFYLKDYVAKVEDIESFMYYLVPHNNLTKEIIIEIVTQKYNLTYRFRKYILESDHFDRYPNRMDQALYNTIVNYSQGVSCYFERFREVNRVYIKNEEMRINKILTDSLGTHNFANNKK